MPITFLLSYWKYIAIIGMAITILLLGIYIKALKAEVSKCNSEKETLNLALEVSQSSVKQLQEAINEQNTAIEKFKSEADRRQKESAAAIARAKADAAAAKGRSEDIMKIRPDPDKPICESINELINEEIRNAK